MKIAKTKIKRKTSKIPDTCPGVPRAKKKDLLSPQEVVLHAFPSLAKNRPTSVGTETVPYLLKESKYYKQEVVYVIGGGPSLRDFDFSLLKNKFVVGCNDAYTLGDEIVDINFYGDAPWIHYHHKIISNKFSGLILTNHWRTGVRYQEYGIKRMKRVAEGISDQDGVLAWNRNSGAASLNVALLLEAKVVVLLGFDMKMENNIPNWHRNLVSNRLGSQVYMTYKKKFNIIRDELLQKFPDVSIVNANPDSALQVFPKMDREEAVACF